MAGDNDDVEVEVVAYSGYKANERPLFLIAAHQKLEIKAILDRWYGQDHDYFKIQTDDGRLYLLKWHRAKDKWFLRLRRNTLSH